MASWVALTVSGGRLRRWIGEELSYWEDIAGPLAVGAAIVLIVVTILHLLAWLARILIAGPRRRREPSNDPASPYTGFSHDNAWDAFSDDGCGDIGGGDAGGVD